jgi:hypothetical protein
MSNQGIDPQLSMILKISIPNGCSVTLSAISVSPGVAGPAG